MKRFNPIRLVQARNWRNYTLDYLAGKVAITKASINLYEKGARNPDGFVQIRLADALNFPVEFFYTNCEEISEIAISYRKKANTRKAGKVKADLLKQFAYEFTSQLQSYVSFRESSVTAKDVDCENLSFEDIDTIAEKIRKELGATLGPIDNLTTFLENRGIFVFLYNQDITDVDGFSCMIGTRPFIFINEEMPWDRIRFTIAHELGHIILHTGIEDSISITKEFASLKEKQAHRFASAFLFPETSFRNEFICTDRDFLLNLKKKWGISMAAIVMRACQLELISETQKESYFTLATRMGERINEPGENLRGCEQPSLIRKALETLFDVSHIDSFYLKSLFHYPDEIMDIVSCGVLMESDKTEESPFTVLN